MAFNKRSWRGDRFSERIGNEGKDADIGDSSVHFTGSAGRTINIDPNAGIEARDSQGTIIHDTPDCVVASDMNYGGHMYWKDTPDFIAAPAISYTDSGTWINEYSTVHTVKLTTSFPGDLTNPSGVLIYVKSILYVSSDKTQLGTLGLVQSFYSNKYNASGTVYNFMGEVYRRCQSVDADDARLVGYSHNQCVVPITWNSTDPYLTFNHRVSITDMGGSSDPYYGKVEVYLQGFLA
jgi:hypothetical protein